MVNLSLKFTYLWPKVLYKFFIKLWSYIRRFGIYFYLFSNVFPRFWKLLILSIENKSRSLNKFFLQIILIKKMLLKIDGVGKFVAKLNISDVFRILQNI